MDKVKINLIGGGFQHTSSTNSQEPKYIQWVKNKYESNTSIYVDNALMGNTNPNTKNYGWLCESKTIIGYIYEWCKNNTETLKANFIKVFTHDVELTKVSDIFVLVQCSGKSFFTHGEVYPKSKLISMVASNKTMCEDHIYRQKMIGKFSNQLDHFGRGFNQLTNKEDGLKDYCFSVVMENATYPNMFTEKITDCFMTGTIPIYHGIKNIGDFFDTNGIITLTEDFKVSDLSFELYNSKLDSIKKNLQLSIDLLVAEDYIYYNFLKEN